MTDTQSNIIIEEDNDKDSKDADIPQSNNARSNNQDVNDEASDNKSGMIDLRKLNDDARLNYKIDERTKLNQINTSNNMDTEEENENGLKKSPWCELESFTGDFDLKFPDYYEIDKLDYTFKRNYLNFEDSEVPPGKEGKDLPNIFLETENNLDINYVACLFKEKNIAALTSNLEFDIGDLIYQHIEEVYHGKLHPMNVNECDAFIKKFNWRNRMELRLLRNELSILFKLAFLNIKTDQLNHFINRVWFYYYDKEEMCFYIFYQYNTISWFEQLKIIEQKSKDNDEVIIEKLTIIKQWLQFIWMLHTNGIMHRDWRIELFNYNSRENCIQTFDFVNAYAYPADIKDSDALKYQNEIRNNWIFITPRYVAPEISWMAPVFGYSQDIWAFSCLSIEIFIKYSEISEELASRLLNRIFRGDAYYKEVNSNDADDKGEMKGEGIGDGTSNDIGKSGVGNSIKNKTDQSKLKKDYKTEKYLVDLIKYPIPKIPTVIPNEIAQWIAKCFYVEPINRPNIITWADKYNDIFKKCINKCKMTLIDITQKTKNALAVFDSIDRINYHEFYNSKSTQKTDNNRWNKCKFHQTLKKNYYCETCNDLFCENSILMAHNQHVFEIVYNDANDKLIYDNKINELRKDPKYAEENKDKDTNFYYVDFDGKKVMWDGNQTILEKMEMEQNFKIIEEFSQEFDGDYNTEKARIIANYDKWMQQVNDLERQQLENLQQSKTMFENKFIYGDVEGKENWSQEMDIQIFYSIRDVFFSFWKRFYNSISSGVIGKENYTMFKKKIDYLIKESTTLRSFGEQIIEKSKSYNIPEKYIFRHEWYTDEMYKSLKSLETKIITEKLKFFDYSDSDSLFLTQELIMIIPLTNCVFSYSKNSYKKFKVSFAKNSKITSFLPGCGTIHQNEKFYVTGGEIKDEATSNFLVMNIDEKKIEEKMEMNSPRRFHTMISIVTPSGTNYIMVIGGWDCDEVEYINTDKLDQWTSLPAMHYKRSDPTAYLFNDKYIYVFGGWNYSLKKCNGEIERYQLFETEGDGIIVQNNQWESLKIKGETISLQKYNMGWIPLINEKTEHSEKVILVGGFDESYDYSQSVIKIEIMQNEPVIFVNKDIKGLPTGGESSFWYEKQFHLMKNDWDGEEIAVNFNCFNNIYVYTFRTSEFKQYANSTLKN